MKRFAIVVLSVFVAVLFLAPNFADALEVGARVSSVSITDDHKSSGFVGSITGLNERDGQLVPFVGVELTDVWSAELSYERLRINTITSNAQGGDVSTDGDYTFWGPRLSVIGHLQNASPFTPYAGAGFSYLVGGFDPVPTWDRTGAKKRHMKVSNGLAPTVFVGTDVRIWKSLYVDLRAGYEWVSADISFSADINGTEVYNKGPFNVPFNSFIASLAVKLKF